MVELGGFAEAGRNLFGNILNLSFYIIMGSVVVGLLGFLCYHFFIYRRRFDILVKIKSERSEDPRIFFDYGAILKDKKTGGKYFRLLKSRIDLASPPFNILEKTNKGDYLEIYRKSEDDFAFLQPPTIDKINIVRADGKIYPVATQDQKQIEADFYWIVKKKEDVKKILDPDTLLSKLLLYAPQLISGMFMFMILWVLLNKLPQVFSSINELIKEMRELNKGQVAAAFSFLALAGQTFKEKYLIRNNLGVTK